MTDNYHIDFPLDRDDYDRCCRCKAVLTVEECEDSCKYEYPGLSCKTCQDAYVYLVRYSELPDREIRREWQKGGN